MHHRLSQLPRARTEGLLEAEMPDGLLIYDTDHDRGHSLNSAATLIWRHCDGRTSVTELTALLRERDLPADEDVVWLALDRLGKANLLRERVARPGEGVSRRAVIRKLALAGGLTALLPVVQSMAAPTPVMAQSPGGSCFPAGYVFPCGSNANPALCCSGQSQTLHGLCLSVPGVLPDTEQCV